MDALLEEFQTFVGSANPPSDIGFGWPLNLTSFGLNGFLVSMEGEECLHLQEPFLAPSICAQ